MAEETPSAPPSQAGKGIGSKLTKKLGPLPVWGWGLVGVVAAYFVYKYISGKSAASAAATTAATAPTTGTTGLGSADTGAGSTASGNGYNGGGEGQLGQILSLLQSQSPSSGASANPPNYQLLNTSADVSQAIAAGWQIFNQPAPGMYTPWNGTAISSGYGTSVEPPTLYTTGVPKGSGTVSGAGGSASPPAQAGTKPTAGTAGAPAPLPSKPGVGPLPPASTTSTHTPLPAVQG